MKYLLLLIITAFVTLPVPAMAASLKQQSIVQSDVLTVGDLFHGVERNADHVLGAAPRPGQTMTLSARTLQRVAVAMDLNWRPSSTRDTLVVRRAATVIDEDTIGDKVRMSLKDEGVNGLYDLLFLSGTPEIILPPHMAETAEITAISFDPDTNWFEAEIAAPSKENMEVQLRVNGKIERLVEVPVLRDTIRSGKVIDARDVEMITVPARHLNHDVILQAAELAGMTPRRMIVAGKPIKEQDVEFPRIVERGQSVTMIYSQGPLQLTATGKALQQGAKGDVIRVVNSQSSRPIDAIITGNREVTIRTF